MNYDMKNEDFQCTSTNYPLDSKNAVRLADFDKSSKWAGEPEKIKNDLEVISVVFSIFLLLYSFIISFPVANERAFLFEPGRKEL